MLEKDELGILKPTSVYKVWDAVKKEWWQTSPSYKRPRETWNTSGGAKTAITSYTGKKYKEYSYRYKVVECISIIYKEVK